MPRLLLQAGEVLLQYRCLRALLRGALGNFSAARGALREKMRRDTLCHLGLRFVARQGDAKNLARVS